MFNRRRSSLDFIRELVCLLLSTVLIAAPALALPVQKPTVSVAPVRFSLSKVRELLHTLVPSLSMSSYATGAMLQIGTSPNLDTLRGTTPLPLWQSSYQRRVVYLSCA